MAKNQNIETSHKGESLEIILAAKNADGTPLVDAADQTVTLTIGRTQRGKKILSFNKTPEIVIFNADASEWLIKIPESKLAGLQQDKVYHYNIWTHKESQEPYLQAYGRLKRLPSIEID